MEQEGQEEAIPECCRDDATLQSREFVLLCALAERSVVSFRFKHFQDRSRNSRQSIDHSRLLGREKVGKYWLEIVLEKMHIIALWGDLNFFLKVNSYI